MKITVEQTVQVGEVAVDRSLRLDALFNIFQEMAVLHTQRVGLSLHELLASGHTWVLSRAVVRIDALPQLDETMTVSTWSREVRRFKGFRDFSISCQGKNVIAASTLWVYLDVHKGRPVRVPDHYETIYGTMPDRAVEEDIEQWLFPDIERSDFLLDVATRLSDYDINGHVNNAVVLQYLQTAIVRYFGVQVSIDEISIMFQKEIPLSVHEVQVRVQRAPWGCLFSIGTTDSLFIKGSAVISGQVQAD